MKKFQIAASLLAAVLMAACGGSKTSLGEVEVNVPEWYANPPQTSDNAVYGTAHETAKNMQMAVEKAKHTATVDLASKYETKVQAMTKSFKEELTGDERELFETVSKTVINTSVMGVQVKEQKIMQAPDGTFGVYVLLEMPLGDANKAFLAKLKEQEALRTKIEASKAFKELEAEIEKDNAKQAM
ncbi:MAG: LPP20 family lipoprotein [Fibrobacterales bacterium]|nr:LPP20 family lipoprotein [Fibrobacterales bacterium]MBP5350671.1 LPP20 family lipoprotein [Fibrobacterales bacterium]